VKVEEILDRLRAAGSPANVAGMARFGIRPALAYGVSTPALQSLAREIGRNQEIAEALWASGIYDARALATLVADAKRISESTIDGWVRDFDCWSVCDSACIHLLWKSPNAWRKVREWADAEREYSRRAAFALLAALAVHDKQAADSRFCAALRLVRRAATDERQYVKKAVNWALRQIGKRNAALRQDAMKMAEQLANSKSKAARWIGSDALRELRARDARALRTRPKAERRRTRSE
jgi:3-methyladenine DNA glycosylase AlkD